MKYNTLKIYNVLHTISSTNVNIFRVFLKYLKYTLLFLKQIIRTNRYYTRMYYNYDPQTQPAGFHDKFVHPTNLSSKKHKTKRNSKCKELNAKSKASEYYKLMNQKVCSKDPFLHD